MSAVHAFNQSHQVTGSANTDAPTAVSTDEAADAWSPRMRRSLEDSASLLLLAGIGAPNAAVALSPSGRLSASSRS